MDTNGHEWTRIVFLISRGAGRRVHVPFESGIVVGLVEDGMAAEGAIEDKKNRTGRSMAAGHGGIVP